jgi:hypothetical protein
MSEDMFRRESHTRAPLKLRSGKAACGTEGRRVGQTREERRGGSELRDAARWALSGPEGPSSVAS